MNTGALYVRPRSDKRQPRMGRHRHPGRVTGRAPREWTMPMVDPWASTVDGQIQLPVMTAERAMTFR